MMTLILFTKPFKTIYIRIMMTDAELKQMGFTRKEWDKLIEDETQYIDTWSKTVDKRKL